MSGQVPGHPLPDWPEWCKTFNERKAYQEGIADARQMAAERVAVPGADGIIAVRHTAPTGHESHHLAGNITE